MNCAANHPRHNWPPAMDISEFQNKAYNVIVYEFADEENGTHYGAFTSDAKGMNGEGRTICEALESLQNVMELIVEDGCGGVYPDTSPFEFQDEDHASLEEMWEEDGVIVANKTYHVIRIFPIAE